MFNEEAYFDLTLNDYSYYTGTTDLNLKKEKNFSFREDILAFFSEAYESGIDGRGYTSISENLILLDRKQNKIDKIHLNPESYHSSSAEVIKINDNLIQIKINKKNKSELKRYNSQPYFRFFKMNDSREFIELKSNREFNFTEFVQIDESYFKGEFSIYVGYTDAGQNFKYTEHLSIDDLDYMRNEIFASYGYIFKSEQWAKVFSKHAWYHPLHENVDDQLTDIDKANIQTILKVKAAMMGKEEHYLKPTNRTFFEAG